MPGDENETGIGDQIRDEHLSNSPQPEFELVDGHGEPIIGMLLARSDSITFDAYRDKFNVNDQEMREAVIAELEKLGGLSLDVGNTPSQLRDSFTLRLTPQGLKSLMTLEQNTINDDPVESLSRDMEVLAHHSAIISLIGQEIANGTSKIIPLVGILGLKIEKNMQKYPDTKLLLSDEIKRNPNNFNNLSLELMGSHGKAKFLKAIFPVVVDFKRMLDSAMVQINPDNDERNKWEKGKGQNSRPLVNKILMFEEIYQIFVKSIVDYRNALKKTKQVFLNQNVEGDEETDVIGKVANEADEQMSGGLEELQGD